MRAAALLVSLSIAASGACGRERPLGARHRTAAAPATAKQVVAAPAAESPCAFDSVAALCTGFREHHGMFEGRMAAEHCAVTDRRASSGAFAEVVVVGVDVRDEGSSPSDPARTERVIAARVGPRWFPVEMISAGLTAHHEWALDPAGSILTVTTATNDPARDDQPYGERESTVYVVDRGEPKIAATARTEGWRRDTDTDCTRACYREDPPPQPPACTQRCQTLVRTTRSFARHGRVVEIGPTVTTIEGHTPAAPPEQPPPEPAETRRLDAPETLLRVCAFIPPEPVVDPVSLPGDPQSSTARDRARALFRNGRWAEVANVPAVLVPGGSTATLEIIGTGGGACGGGGCTVAVDYRPIEGLVPVDSISTYVSSRGRERGCPPEFPRPGTFLQVAQATTRHDLDCALIARDARSERFWAIVKYFVPR